MTENWSDFHTVQMKSLVLRKLLPQIEVDEADVQLNNKVVFSEVDRLRSISMNFDENQLKRDV